MRSIVSGLLVAALAGLLIVTFDPLAALAGRVATQGGSGERQRTPGQEGPAANKAPVPPPGGMTQVLAGTTDIEALIAA